MKVSVVLPLLFTDSWQPELAQFSIKTMRMRTGIDFELVIVETGSTIFEKHDMWDQVPVVYKSYSEKTTYTRDFNCGIDAANGDYIVHTAMDIIVGDRWLESMIDCFDQRSDCGVATICVKEGGHLIGTDMPHNSIVESFYGAIMMFQRGYRLDKSFPDAMSDYDLCMQVYSNNQRAYRNNASQAFHMKFEHGLSQEEKNRRLKYGVGVFQEKWKGHHWLIKDLILRGGVQYGRENA